jgi:hypothetical protein
MAEDDKTIVTRLPSRCSIKGVLTDTFDKTIAAQLALRIKTRYNKLHNERELLKPAALDKHLVGNIFPWLAFYEEVLAIGQSQEYTIELVKKGLAIQMRVRRKQFEFIGRFPFFYTMIQKMTPALMKRGFPSPGFEIKWLEVSKRQVAFNMCNCFYLDTLRKYGAPELITAFCWADDYMYDDVSPHMHWNRTQTMGSGGEYCDFRFVRAGLGKGNQ